MQQLPSPLGCRPFWRFSPTSWFCGAVAAPAPLVQCDLSASSLRQGRHSRQSLPKALCSPVQHKRRERGSACGTTGCDAGAGESTGSVLILQGSQRSSRLAFCYLGGHRWPSLSWGIPHCLQTKVKGKKIPRGGMHRRRDFPLHSRICDCLNQQQVL